MVTAGCFSPPFLRTRVGLIIDASTMTFVSFVSFVSFAPELAAALFRLQLYLI